MQIIKANSKDYKELLSRNSKVNKRVVKLVREIIENVSTRGDAALMEYTKKFDNAKFRSAKEMKVSEREISASFQNVDSKLILAIKKAIENSTEFYKKQMPKNFRMKNEQGAVLEERYVPVERVGLYVPAGQAPLVSTVYMCAIPAIVAGVKEIVLMSPPNEEGYVNPFILATANMLKITEIYKGGGAQAIAAMAHGTKTIKKVDMIVGPGNEYVAEAKRQVYGTVGIDMFAGPSEVIVVANKNSNMDFIIADLKGQTEHRGGFGIVVYIGNAMPKELKELEVEGGFVVQVKNTEEAQQVVNDFAPEHLAVLIKGARKFLKGVVNAGAVFINEYTPVALGDYIAGPSHVLPTAGTAKFSSGLSVHDFLKRIHYIEYTKKALQADADALESICKLEKMNMHLDSVLVRLGRSVNDEVAEENGNETS